MRILLLIFSSVLLVCGLEFWVGVSEAWAHGGNFRSDGPQPGMDPDAPRLPGDMGRRSPTTSRPGSGRSTWLAGTWHTWWRLNADAYLPDRRSVRERVSRTESASFFQMGEDVSSALSQWERAIREGAEKRVVPVLVKLTQPRAGADSEVLAAALLALGRTAHSEKALTRFEHHALDRSASIEVRESAVLAIGLLRRSDPDLQLAPPHLRRARTFLLHLFDDKDVPNRVRAFAMYSIALLADQPYGTGPLERHGRGMTRELWQRLCRTYPAPDLPISVLAAMGMQPRAGVATGVLKGLRTIAAGKAFRRKKWDGLARSHALSAYVQLDGPAWLDVVLWSLRGTRDHVSVRCAAAIALQRRAPQLDAAERLRAATTLRRSLPREPNWLARGLGQMAIGCLIREELVAGGSSLTETLQLDAWLQHEARKGRNMTRPFAALAMGLSVFDLPPQTKSCALCLRETRRALLDGLRKARGADDVLGAYAVALGLAKADTAHADLLAILEDRHRGASLRGYCAVALAQIGRDTPAVRAALQSASKERVSPLVHTAAVRALSLLAPPGTADQLLDQLQKTRARYSVAIVAGALGRFGDPVAADALIKRAATLSEPVAIRTMSVVALGLIFDPEPRPSRIILTTNANYPARTPALTQIFNIQ